MYSKLETENLLLIACDRDTLEHAISGNQQLAKYLNVVVPDKWTEFGSRALKYSLNKLNSGESEEGWWTYFPIHKGDNKLIGTGGYKGKPHDNGIVEIGYEIAAAYRNQGLATELANALMTNAFASDQVNSVEAYTMGETNASTRVLTKCGFQKIDQIKDNDNGLLWKWQIKKRKMKMEDDMYQKIIRNYIKGYNNFNVDQMLVDMDENIRFENISNGETNLITNGIIELKAQAEQAKQFFKEREQAITSFTIDNDQVEISIDYKGVLAIDFPNGLKAGDTIELKGKSIFKFKNNKIIELKDIS